MKKLTVATSTRLRIKKYSQTCISLSDVFISQDRHIPEKNAYNQDFKN